MRSLIIISILTIAWTCGLAQSKRAYLRDEGKGRNRNIVYIDYNRHSKYYNLITDFRLDRYGHMDEYKESVGLLKKDNRSPLPKRILGDLPLKWCSLQVYQSECFVYYPSDPSNNYRIAFNDTTVIEYGYKITASQILSVKKVNDHVYNITRRKSDRTISNIVIHIVDRKNGTALVEGVFPLVKYVLMAPANKVHNFELIVNYCKSSKCPEYPFNPNPDLRNLMGRL